MTWPVFVFFFLVNLALLFASTLEDGFFMGAPGGEEPGGGGEPGGDSAAAKT